MIQLEQLQRTRAVEMEKEKKRGEMGCTVETARTSRGREEEEEEGEEEGEAEGAKKRTCLAKAREVVDLRPWKVGIWTVGSVKTAELEAAKDDGVVMGGGIRVVGNWRNVQ